MKFLKDGGWIFFIPGFLALFIAGFISDFPIIRDSQLPIVYLSLTIVSCAFPLAITHIILKYRRRSISITRLMRSATFWSSILVSSIGVGLLFGMLHTTDVVSTKLRSIFGKELIAVVSHDELVRELFSRSYSGRFPDGRPDFRSNTTSLYAKVTFSGSSIVYEGVIENWYGGSTRPQVYLSPACQIDNDATLPVKGPGVWLNMSEMQTIQFIDDTCSLCASELEVIAGRKPSSVCSY